MSAAMFLSVTYVGKSHLNGVAVQAMHKTLEENSLKIGNQLFSTNVKETDASDIWVWSSRRVETQQCESLVILMGGQRGGMDSLFLAIEGKLPGWLHELDKRTNHHATTMGNILNMIINAAKSLC